MPSFVRLARGRFGRLSVLAVLLFVLAPSAASAALAPTRTAISTAPKTSARMGDVVAPIANVSVAGAAVPQAVGGDIDFRVCGPLGAPTGCPTGGTLLGTRGTASGNTDVAGPIFTPPSPGYYCFRADYRGTSTHEPSSGSGPSGCLRIVSKVTLTVAYSSSPTVGQPFSLVFDLRDEQGQPVIGSLIVGQGDGCAAGGPWSETIPIVNGKATTSPYTPTSTASLAFSWQMPAGGYDLYAGCRSAAVAPAPTTNTATLSAKTVRAGQPVTVRSTVTASPGLGTPTGYIRFRVCGPTPTAADCALGVPLGDAEDLVNGSVTSRSFQPTEAGFYCFRAAYFPAAGSKFAGSQAGGPTNCTELATAGSGISFALAYPESGLGENAWIEARVTRPGGIPTGNVQFRLCGPFATPEGCPNPSQINSHRGPLQDGVATGPQFLPEGPSYYCLWARYEGDAQTPGMTEGGPSGCFRYTTWRSTLDRLSPYNAELKGGKGKTDRRFSVLVSSQKAGGANGTVSSWVCGPLRDDTSGCRDGGTPLGASPVVGGSGTTNEVVATGVGFYCVRSVFTPSDPLVRESSSGGDADGGNPTCMRVGLAPKVLTPMPLTKVAGEPDPTPRLIDPADPSISGAPNCFIRAHDETPGTKFGVVECWNGTLTSPDWVLSVGSRADLTILPKPLPPTPTPTPTTPTPTTPSPTTPAGTPTPAGDGSGQGQGQGPSPAPAPAPPGGGTTAPGGGPPFSADSALAPSNLATITKLVTRKGVVTLTLRLPGAGSVLVTVQAGKKSVTRTIAATKAGTVIAKFTAKQLRKLTAKTKRGKKVKLKVQARFSPTGGTARTVGPRTLSHTVK